MADELIQIVDEKDQPIQGATKKDAWQQGLIHRIVRMIAEDGKGNVLLQKRTTSMELYPGRWSESASGHVDEGESYDIAAQREISEEIGLKNIKLKEIGYFRSSHTNEWRKLERFNRCYTFILHETPTELQASEVTSVKWFSIEEIKRLIVEHPKDFTDGVAEVFTRFY